MTKKEIEFKLGLLKQDREVYKGYLTNADREIAELEQELKKLEVKVYEPDYIIFAKGVSEKEVDCYEQHNAMEEYKHELFKLNNGWFPDWSEGKQSQAFAFQYHFR
jgi:SMC interacting uncharacterized protein involved in chromosome segregation